MAKARAARPYSPPADTLPAQLSSITYDAYRAIRFRSDHALWGDRAVPFQAQFFHRGLYFRDGVEIFEVEGGQARPVPYDPAAFNSDLADLSGLDPRLGFAGFRLHTPIKRRDYFDEAAVFLGASYFRSLGRDNVYGLSARGLAINTGGAGGEEFPAFRQFWIERPTSNAQSIVVHALLDSPSVAGAYRFVIRPGESTVFDVEARLFPRGSLATVGFAPLTSMFLFGPASPRRFDDFRPAVHDSDGLAIHNGQGERLWRPLTNPAQLQESVFADNAPRGFGLLQRSRRLTDFEDLEARYDQRPSVWIEPQGDWGPGAVHLFEIPSGSETEDNVVAFWRPAAPIAGEIRLGYRMSWGPPPSSGLAEIMATRTGEAFHSKDVRLFTIDFAKPAGGWDGVEPRVIASAGELSPPTLSEIPQTGAMRVGVHLTPGKARTAELRADLMGGGRPVSETWMYRWTA